MPTRIIALGCLLALTTLSAVAAEHSDAAGITWFNGDVNAAFAEAQTNSAGRGLVGLS